MVGRERCYGRLWEENLRASWEERRCRPPGGERIRGQREFGCGDAGCCSFLSRSQDLYGEWVWGSGLEGWRERSGLELVIVEDRRANESVRLMWLGLMRWAMAVMSSQWSRMACLWAFHSGALQEGRRVDSLPYVGLKKVCHVWKNQGCHSQPEMEGEICFQFPAHLIKWSFPNLTWEV